VLHNSIHSPKELYWVLRFSNEAGGPHCIQNTSSFVDVHRVLLSAGQTGPGVIRLEETVVGGEELVIDGRIELDDPSGPGPDGAI
jgi:hypothetical protein